MEITPILDGLRMQFPACAHVGYADLKARMVLATSSDNPMPQERWENLCETAVDLLIGDLAGESCTLLPNGVFHAILADGEILRLFVRSLANPNDVLCFVCATHLAVGELMQKAQLCLKEIDQYD